MRTNKDHLRCTVYQRVYLACVYFQNYQHGVPSGRSQEPYSLKRPHFCPKLSQHCSLFPWRPQFNFVGLMTDTDWASLCWQLSSFRDIQKLDFASSSIVMVQKRAKMSGKGDDRILIGGSSKNTCREYNTLNMLTFRNLSLACIAYLQPACMHGCPGLW